MGKSKTAPIEIGIDVGRILYGLSRIGYNTVSAITDIIDNSVRAKAQNITVLIQKERKDFTDRKRNNVREYTIIDDGNGMNEDEIKEALKLGSSELSYEKNSLSKFGLGLKSACFSQADLLEIISSNGKGPFIKYIVSLQEVINKKKYLAHKKKTDDYDNDLISKYLANKKGTIVRISNVRKINHPSVSKTVEELLLKLGVIYFYFLKNDDLTINIGNKKINPIDPLFIEEANLNDNLDENTWEGKDVRWIEKNREILLDDEEKIKATIEITQLPYPPIFNLIDSKGADKKIRDKYLIGSGNYGFYVYRNKRLISWASQLQGIIPIDQGLFCISRKNID
jgi:hypothetical protein